MTTDQQVERLNVFHLQLEQASKEGLILVMGDMNIDIDNWEDSNYYLKKVAEKYQLIIAECGLDLINFGITWCRTHKNGNVLKSSIDHALTNKSKFINFFRSVNFVSRVPLI